MLQQNSSATNSYYFGTADSSPGLDPIDLIPGQWSHIVLIRDGNKKEKSYYLNGAFVKKVTGGTNISYSGQFLRLGRFGGGGRNWNGSIDDVRIYDRALSSGEVSALTHDLEPVISAFTVNPNAGSSPLAVDFTCRATSQGTAIAKYLWDIDSDGFADAITTTGKLSYVYDANGLYNPSVTVVDKLGSYSKSGKIKVTVNNGAELYGKVEYYQFDDATKAINVKFRVFNTGNVAASLFKVGFSVSDNGVSPTTFKTESLGGLAVGQNKLLDVSYTFPESVYGRQIAIAIDSEKKIAEVDETNNITKIVVGP